VTLEHIDKIFTSRIVYARIRLTLIDLLITGLTNKARDAITGEIIYLIFACGFIKAWKAGTFINVYFALFTSEARDTSTVEICYKVGTGTVVLAWIGIALIYF